jgi:hypothetical protein
VPWEDFLSETRGDITDIWAAFEARLCPRLRFRVSNISLLRKSAEDARKDAKLWASRSEGDDTVDVDFPLDEDDYAGDSPTTAEHYQSYTALLWILQNAVRHSGSAGASPALQAMLRDPSGEAPAEDGRPLVRRHERFYQQIRHLQDGPLRQYPSLSREDVQAAAKAQDMLHLRMLDEMESGIQDATHPTSDGDVDDILARNYDTDAPPPRQAQEAFTRAARMLVDVSPATGFVELGRQAASGYTLITGRGPGLRR